MKFVTGDVVALSVIVTVKLGAGTPLPTVIVTTDVYVLTQDSVLKVLVVCLLNSCVPSANTGGS